MTTHALGWSGRGATPDWTLDVARVEDEPAAAVAAPAEGASDAELVAATRAGSNEAFDEIVRRHQRSIYQLCYRYVGNHEDANDLAQDVFLRAYRGLKTYKGDASLSTWLYRIGVNVCLNKVTSKAPRLDRMQSLDAVQHPDTRDEHAEDALLRKERAARVREAIATLPPKQRATLILRMYHDLPHEEIANLLGSSVGASKANLFHALNRLRAVLQS